MFLILPSYLVNNFAIRLLLAAVLGACIGLERDIRGRSAGLRTNILVSLGSAVFTILSIAIAESYASGVVAGLFSSDPTRIMAQIVTGIGFLGAGAIIKSGLSIRGLTTAACLWITSAIGMCCGAGYYDVAILTTIIAILVLTLLVRVEHLYSKDAYRVLEILAPIDTDTKSLLQTVTSCDLDLIDFDQEKNYQDKSIRLVINIRLRNRDMTDKSCHTIIENIEKTNPEIKKIIWRHP